MADAPEERTTEEPKRRRDRSPNYPGITLETALQRAETLWERERQRPQSVDMILRYWGYKPKSGGGAVAFSALQKFGLLMAEGSGANRQGRLTDLAVQIIRDPRPGSTDRAEAVQRAALTPAIHREIWDRYRETGLPPDPDLEYYLIFDRHFTESGAREFIQELKATLDFAGITQGDTLPANGEDTSEIQLSGPSMELEKNPLPGATQTLRAPLGSGRSVVVQMPERMDSEEWKLFEANLAAWKLATVKDDDGPES